MKNVIVLIMVLLLSFSCKSYDYNITSLKKKTLKYEELPFEVKKYLANLPKCEDYDMFLFVDSADTMNYIEKTVETLTGPWVDYEKIIDKRKDISYRINQGVPSPYIVFRNKLYISDRYDILCGNSIVKAIYTEYQLK